ncbi:uncharacterized protein KY384_006253 [Bacidia gigantensis]|uniref:uncharacterized protein n=1 Tax=Bacidia gigantensis TaxID=2732470 RepID=UPI001D03E65A|nr:uncharacterized protein KY384_006253 [Bacidia gigantensis]KAG8529616.1 hypothetical protein KY384_006253 [Bacidia gigantensis]
MAQVDLYDAFETTRCVRLFELLPGKRGDALQGHLRVSNFDKRLYYEAVSYVWGSETDPVDLNCDGHQVKITQNLAAALRRFRREDSARTLWVDSVCINQANLQERSHQVHMMSDIYRKASCVLIWLGEDEENDASDAFACVRQLVTNIWSRKEDLARYVDLNGFMVTSKNADEIKAKFKLPSTDAIKSLDRLFAISWFDRAWTFQEYYVAREKTFFWGLHLFLVEDVVKALRSLLWLHRSTGDKFFDLHILNKGSQIISDEKSKSFRTGEERRDFFTIISRRRGTSCKDPRDLVYSIKGIITNGSLIEVDYSQPWRETFAASTARYISSSGNLDIFRDVCPGEQHAMLPSWVPDWRAKVRSPLLRMTVSLARPYHCSASSKAMSRLSSSYMEIRLHGILWDSIIAMNNQETETDMIWMQKKILNIPRDRTLDFQEQQELVNFCSKDFVYLPTSEDAFECYTRLACLDLDPLLFDRRLNRQSMSKEPKTEGYIHSLIKSQKQYMHGQNLAFTKYRRLGVVPGWARPGDVVAILMGGEVPIILRPDLSDGKYTLIGESYMHGFMDGEALVEARKQSDPSYDTNDTSWLEDLHEGQLPFPTTEFIIK